MKARARWAAVLAAAALSTAGCMDSSKGYGPVSGQTDEIQGAITLETFASCDEVEQYLKGVAKDQIELQYDAAAKGGCFGCGYDWAVPVDAPASGGANGEPTGGGSSGGEQSKSVEYTKTNTQEEGVDEADFVKTDGQWLYMLRGGALVVVEAVPAADAAVVSTTPIAGSPLEMFVSGDVAVVFSTDWGYSVEQSARSEDGSPKAWNDRMRVTVVDVSDRAAPKVVRESLYEGTYVSSRLVGDSVRAVMRTLVGTGPIAMGGGTTGGTGGGTVPVNGGTVEPVSDGGAAAKGDEAGVGGDPVAALDAGTVVTGGDAAADTTTWEQQLETQKQEALAKIDALTLEQLTPLQWEVTRDADGEATLGQPQRVTACSGYYKPSLEYGPSMVTVVTLRISDPTADLDNATIIGNGDTVYASADRLYLAADIYNGWYAWYPDKQEDWQWTAVHAFDIGSFPDRAVYVGSGKVPGRVLNQFSMSEYEGDLRVATTKDLWTQGDNVSESMVSVLRPVGEDLTVIGQVTGLGKGERIYSARFLGTRGFVVTFEQVDPLYALDLSDPTAPVVEGELKVPGFSTYIHPVGEDFLLTIGRDTLDNGQWVQLAGVQLALYDVSDLAAPSQAFKTVIGTSGTHSDALYDHKAFTYLESKGILAVPLTTWGVTEPSGGGVEPGVDPGTGPGAVPDYFTGAAVYDVSVDAGFSLRGYVDHSSFAEETGWKYEQVSRTVIIGDAIYTIGQLGVKVSDLLDLSELAAVDLPQSAGYSGGGGTSPPSPVEPTGAD